MNFTDTHPSRLQAALRAMAVALPLVIGTSSASAIASLPTSGTCGFISTMQYPFAYMYGQSPGTGWGLNVIGTLNFDTKTIAVNVVQINPALTNSTQTQQSGSGTFAVAAGPVPGSYLLTSTVTLTGGSPNPFFSWNVIPANGGNTLLLQASAVKVANAADGGMASVCQF